MQRMLFALFYVMVALVVLSELRTVWLALAKPQQFLAHLPAARGPIFPVIVLTSALAGLNAVMVAARFRWAVWLNVAIGVFSIVLLQIVGAPAVNSFVVAIACAIVAGVPLMTWMRRSDPAKAEK